jgi:ribosomal-protein-alanine N-acetyltransferase
MKLPVIASLSLILYPFRERDVEELHLLWAAPRVRKFLWDNDVIPVERAAAVVFQSVESSRPYGIGMWRICERSRDVLLGFRGFRFIGDTTDLELLYGLRPQYWGRGLAKEASRAVLTFVFTTTQQKRVLAGADAENIRSFAVRRRLGMHRLSKGIAAVPGAVYYEIKRSDFVADRTIFWQ